MPTDELSKLQNRVEVLEDENGRLLAKIDRLELEQSQPNVSQTIHGLSVMVLQHAIWNSILYNWLISNRALAL